MSLFSALNVSGSGLAAQRQRVETLAQNVANAQTTRTVEGGPYRRQHVTFESEPQGFSTFDTVWSRFQAAGGRSDPAAEGVRVSEIVADETPPERRYLPGHPDAGADGYVEFPAFNPVEDMVDLTAGVRSYQANLAAIRAIREMISRTLEISR
jgi:flagellar basal-body rod protein FlgC